MTMLPTEAIKEYQDIYKKLHGKSISYEQATKSANQLINLVNLVEKTSNGNDYAELYDHTK